MFYRVNVVGFMTGFAIDGNVFSDKLIIRLIVVKRVRFLQYEKGFFRMALDAILSKAIFVYILMTVYAIFMRNICKFLELPGVANRHFMAFIAFGLDVLTMQREGGFFVIEFRGGFESYEIVAGKTVLRQGILVIIVMAGEAGCIKTKVGLLFLFDLRAFDVFLLVAVCTFFFRMGVLQFVTC